MLGLSGPQTVTVLVSWGVLACLATVVLNVRKALESYWARDIRRFEIAHKAQHPPAPIKIERNTDSPQIPEKQPM